MKPPLRSGSILVGYVLEVSSDLRWSTCSRLKEVHSGALCDVMTSKWQRLADWAPENQIQFSGYNKYFNYARCLPRMRGNNITVYQSRRNVSCEAPFFESCNKGVVSFYVWSQPYDLSSIYAGDRWLEPYVIFKGQPTCTGYPRRCVTTGRALFDRGWAQWVRDVRCLDTVYALYVS